MGARKSTVTVSCKEPGCHESAFYEFDSQKDRHEFTARYKAWQCVRHSMKDRVVTPERTRVEWTSQAVRQESYGKFSGHHGILIGGSAYYAEMKDFPVGTIFKITCEAIMPERNGGSDE